jgi:hypothetical protein
MELKKIKNVNEWHNLVSISENYNLFSSPNFLDGLSCPYDFFIVEENNNPLLASIVFKKHKSYEKFFFQDFNYNQGIYFLVKKKNKQFEALEFFIKEITAKFDYLRFSLNYNSKDIRPFQWYNYPESKFKINIVYSSILNLTNFNSEEEIKSNMRYSRRRELKLFDKSDFKIVISDDYENFIKNYNINYKGIMDKFVLDTHSKLILNSKKKKFSRLNIIKKKDKTFGATIFYFDKKTAFYAFSFFEKNKEALFSITTPLIYEQINFFYNKGIKYIDFLGVNSPGRGDYKESFGGDLVNFYELNYSKL